MSKSPAMGPRALNLSAQTPVCRPTVRALESPDGDAEGEEMKSEEDAEGKEVESVEDAEGEKEVVEHTPTRRPKVRRSVSHKYSARLAEPEPEQDPDIDPERTRLAFLEELKGATGKFFIDKVNKSNIRAVLGPDMSGNNPLLLRLVGLCKDKNAFLDRNRGITKTTLVEILQYIYESNTAFSGNSYPKMELNAKILDWYRLKTPTPPQQSRSSTGEAKLHYARHIKTTIDGWKQQAEEGKKPDPRLVMVPEYLAMAHGLLVNAFYAGLFDDEHVAMFKDNDGKAGFMEQFVLVEELNVLGKQLGVVFNGASLIQKSSSVHKYVCLKELE